MDAVNGIVKDLKKGNITTFAIIIDISVMNLVLFLTIFYSNVLIIIIPNVLNNEKIIVMIYVILV